MKAGFCQDWRHIRTTYLLLMAAILYFCFTGLLSSDYPVWVRFVAVFSILGIGAGYIFYGTAKVIEKTTSVLSTRTKIAGGLLQSLGTAFPDMVMGIIAAFMSLRVKAVDYPMAINYAILATATTFGSNIYNTAYAIWCIFRQNTANRLGRAIPMFPVVNGGGLVTPMQKHQKTPSREELDIAVRVMNSVSVLTAFIAVCMVLFGRITSSPAGVTDTLYQLIRPVGVIVMILCVSIMFYFRKTKRSEDVLFADDEDEKYYNTEKNSVIWLHLFISAGAILLAGDSMVRAIVVFCTMTGIPFIIAGVLTGLVCCLAEIMVVHSYTVNPKGTIGDAIVGIGMDNIMTTLGAAVVAIIGGIYLGGSGLIIIFVLIFTVNSLLVTQIAKLKNYVRPG